MDYMCGRIGDLNIAIPLSRVVGVTQSTTVTPIPFAPPVVVGLTMAIGTIVPQIELGAVMGQRHARPGLLIVVRDDSGRFALLVDRIKSVLSVEEIAPFDPAIALIEGPVLEKALAGCFSGQFHADGEPYWVIDHAGLLEQNFIAREDGEAGSSALALAGGEEIRDDALGNLIRQDGSLAKQAYAVAEVCGMRYAIALKQVLEIIVVPHVYPLPGAPNWLRGCLNLRERVLPVIDTARLLGIGQIASSRSAIMVRGAEGRSLALLVEKVAGIEEFGADDLQPMTRPMAGIGELIATADGEIISVLSPQALLAQVEETLTGLGDVATGSGPAHARHTQAGDEIATERILVIRVEQQYFGIALKLVERIPGAVQLTQVPDTASGFDALSDVGGAILPVIDLRRHLRGPGAKPGAQAICAITLLEGSAVALAFDQVLNVESVPHHEIRPVNRNDGSPVSHVIDVRGTLIALLDLDRLLPGAASLANLEDLRSLVGDTDMDIDMDIGIEVDTDTGIDNQIA